MSRVPLGKVLLRNVIRHTDAHNKIQEESEMWKVRELEKQTEKVYGAKRRQTPPELNKWDHGGYKELYPEEFDDKKSRMRSDCFEADGSKEHLRGGADDAVKLTPDALSVRAFNKKFYACEASIPDRWGHSGYKELYPEEFDTDSDNESRSHKRKANGQEKSRRGTARDQESHKRKRSKKAHKKKQKKHSHKKLKKRKKSPEEAAETSSDSETSDESEDKPKKSKHKKKTRKKASRKQPTSSGQDCGSSSDESSTEEEHKSRRTKRSRKKPHHRSKSKKDTETAERKSRRTNWKVAKDESSGSSDEED